MQQDLLQELFETSEGGVSSAYDAAMLDQSQLAWQINGQVRGGKPGTRPGMKERLVLPSGLVQGVAPFSVQGGMLVAQIAGRLYRIRIDGESFSDEQIQLGFINSPVRKEVWMQETVGSLIIQDDESEPIIYDGSTARRPDRSDSVGAVEVPRGRMMAYINGRLWVAINQNEVVAGDIKTNQFGSELKFTETQYLSGGGAFYFPNKISALAGMPATSSSGYGSLIVFGTNHTESIRADATNRDLWGLMPSLIEVVMLNVGCVSQYSCVEVNQDLFWRDADGAVRSLRSSVVSEASGSVPQSREISRIVDHESHKHLTTCSAIFFDNRLLATASPFINEHGGISFRKLISLDFAPASAMRSAAPPAYDGEWTGLNFVRLAKGRFRGKQRAFAISTDSDGENRLWEIMPSANKDQYITYV